MRLSHTIHEAGRFKLTVRHVVLVALLVGVAILLRADEKLPTAARIPGIVILLALCAWLLGSPHHRRPTHRESR